MVSILISVLVSCSLLTPPSLTVPVVAVFTKFDDLIVQVYDEGLDDGANRHVAESELQKKFQTPLDSFTVPPRAHVRMEGVSEVVLVASSSF